MIAIKRYIYLIAMVLFLSLSAFAALDLRWVGGFTISPASPGNNQEVSFIATFRTWGGPVSNLKIIGGVDGTTLYDFTHPSLPQGINLSLQFNWTSIPGTHTAWFKLDPNHTTGDTNYANNNISQQFTVSSEPPKPNLVVTDCDYEPHSFKDGDTVLFKFTIKNNGNGQAPVPSKAEILISDKHYDTLTLPAMGPGWTNSYSFSYTAKIPSSVTIKADSTSLIAESNENDNSCTKTFKLVILDFIPKDLSIPKK